MLKLVKPMILGGQDDALVQRVFDEAVHADVDRLAKQVKEFVYGVTLDQLLGDRMRVVADSDRITQIVDELLTAGLFVRFEYKNHKPLIFHRENLERETVTRRTFALIAA